MSLILMTVQAVALAAALGAGPSWEPIGNDTAVSVDAGTITLRADDAATAGAVSSPVSLTRDCDALLVTCRLSDADAHAVTISANDASTGAPLGYWQNPLAVTDGVRETAVLQLTHRAEAIRLFIGADDHASHATVSDIRITPLHRAEAYTSVQFGAAVTAGKPVGQTFKAQGRHLAGLTFRMYFTRSFDGPRPDLRARLYAWDGGLRATRKTKPIAEVVVPGRQIPAGSHGVERDVMLPLQTEVTPGKTYLVELTLSGPTPDAPPLVLYAGPDAFPGGEAYTANRAKGWDLNTQIFYQAE